MEESKLTNQQYKFVCELLWGGVPVDKEWAIGTSLFKQEAPKILKLYPMLDKSFFELRNLDTRTSKQHGLDTALSRVIKTQEDADLFMSRLKALETIPKRDSEGNIIK